MTDEPSWNLKLQPSTNETYAGSFPVLTKADEHQVFSLVNGVLTTGNRFTPDNDVSKALYGGIAPGDVIPDDAKASPELRFGLGAEASKIRFVSALACNWQGTLYSQLLPDDARIDPHFEGGEDKEGEFIQFFPQYMASNANYGGWWSADLVITPTGPGSP
ncbi:MAG: hypothetical protein M1833_002724 [Piccolia ochrophora]|nr:MAG: hypothetical protein M1833_002724 [Piccolia ochrophora]